MHAALTGFAAALFFIGIAAHPAYGQEQDCMESTHRLWLLAPGARAIEAEAFLVEHFTGLDYVDDQGRLTHPDRACYIALPLRGNTVGVIPYLPPGDLGSAEKVIFDIQAELEAAFADAGNSFPIIMEGLLTSAE